MRKDDPKGYSGEGKDMKQRKKKKCSAPNGRPAKWRFWVTGTAKPTEIPAVLLQWKYNNNNENSEIKTALASAPRATGGAQSVAVWSATAHPHSHPKKGGRETKVQNCSGGNNDKTLIFHTHLNSTQGTGEPGRSSKMRPVKEGHPPQTTQQQATSNHPYETKRRI